MESVGIFELFFDRPPKGTITLFEMGSVFRHMTANGEGDCLDMRYDMSRVLGCIRRFLRRQIPVYTAEQISILDTVDLHVLLESEQCQSNTNLLVMAWIELRSREQVLPVLSQPTISLQRESRDLTRHDRSRQAGGAQC